MNIQLKGLSLVLLLTASLSFQVLAADEAAQPPPAQNQAENAPPPNQPPAPAPPRPEASPRDVFKPGLSPVETPDQLSPEEAVEIQTVLEGLSMSEKGNRAVINGDVYKEGEEKKGIKVIQIRKKEVDILINQSVRRRLSMLPGETRDLPPEEGFEGESSYETEAEPISRPAQQVQNKEPSYV